MAKADGEETLKQKALGFIFEKNPLVYMWNHMWVEKPKPFSEMNKWEKQLKGIDTTWRDDRMNDDGGRPAISRHLDIHQQNVGFPDFLGVSDTTIIAMDISENACSTLERSAFECLEYYGRKRGTVICKDYYDDFQECSGRHISQLRFMAMRAARNKRWAEYMQGKRDYSTVYLSPPMPGTYLDPCINPKDKVHADPV